MFRPIHHTFAPHVDTAYALHALRLLLMPWTWRRGPAQEELAAELAERFHGDVTLFSSGRESILALLQSLHLKRGDEVIVQGYTCVAVPNAITAAGGTPVYADIDRESLNLTAATVESLVSNRTRAVICQHTFGIPADTAALRDLCDQYELPLIEDCAHVMPDETGPKEIGRHGDFLIFSFGRDKAVSGIAGGALVAKGFKFQVSSFRLQSVQHTTIVRLLLYPLIYAIARPLIGIGVGKAILLIARWLRVLIPIETKEEKAGTMDRTLHRMPNACAALALVQWKELKSINDHRRKLTAFYLEACNQCGWQPLHSVNETLPLQKFPLFFQQAEFLLQELKSRNIHLNDGWTGCVVCPPGIDLDPTHYKPGSDPEAEAACEKILNLPTHPTMTLKQGKRLITALAQHFPAS